MCQKRTCTKYCIFPGMCPSGKRTSWWNISSLFLTAGCSTFQLKQWEVISWKIHGRRKWCLMFLASGKITFHIIIWIAGFRLKYEWQPNGDTLLCMNHAEYVMDMFWPLGKGLVMSQKSNTKPERNKPNCVILCVLSIDIWHSENMKWEIFSSTKFIRQPRRPHLIHLVEPQDQILV